MSDKHTELLQKSMSCLHMARAINDAYPDSTAMPAEKFQERKALLNEARRLRELADIQKTEDDLTTWATTPADEDSPAVKAINFPAGGGGQDPGSLLAGAHKQLQMKSFLMWMQGAERTQEQKAALVENATGEILVPHDVVTPILKTLPHLGTFRSAGPTIRNTTSNKVDVRSVTNATAGWGKLETGGALTDANVAPVTPDVIEVHDLVALSQVGVDELADTDVDNLPGLIQQIVGLKFAEMEDDAFANGSGTSRPFGLAMRATQGSPLITQAVTSAATAVHPDDLKRLPYRVPSRYRGDGAYFLSDDASEAVSLLKDSTSNYLWQPSIRAGEPATLFGYRAYPLEGLPRIDSGNSTPSILFGDPGLGYMVADRQQISMQRLDERYAELGLVGFLFKLRVGGDVIRPAAFAKYIVL